VNFIKNIAGLFLLFFMFSCGKNINIDDILKNENNFKLTIYLSNKYNSDSTIIKTINKNSKKISKLKEWITNNPDGWQSSNYSWATPDISLIGNNFRLLIFTDFIVIGFVDKKWKQKQYTKQVNKLELDFISNNE